LEAHDDSQRARDRLARLLKHPANSAAAAHKKEHFNQVKPGRYEIDKGMGNNEIINLLRSQNKPLPVIFNNQNRLVELAHRISVQLEADSLSLMQAMTDSTFLAENGFTPANALNMYIPNKYQFYWNTSAREFRRRMLK